MRQTFTVGQTVYIKIYGRSYQRAIVAEPDKTRSAYSPDRFVRYVGVHHVKPDGTVGDDRIYDVLNDRRMILDEAAFAKIQQGKQIDNRRRLIAAHNLFEREFASYAEQADIIIKALGVDGADKADDLAHYLYGAFIDRAQYGRRTRDDVRKLRRDNAEAARVATEELRAMGVEP